MLSHSRGLQSWGSFTILPVDVASALSKGNTVAAGGMLCGRHERGRHSLTLVWTNLLLLACSQVVAIPIAVAYGIFISQFVAPWYGSQHALDLMSASLRATGRALTDQYAAFEEVSP